MRTRLLEAHLYLTAAIVILAALFFATTSAHALAAPRLFVTHRFTGRVSEVREISLLGYPAIVARVETPETAVWVIQKLDTVTLGHARPGDQVQVSIRGPHVFSDHVDWSLCQPAGSEYCRWGAIYEEAPLSLDWGVPLSYSNQFLHFGGLGPYYGNALYWWTEAISAPTTPATHPARGWQAGVQRRLLQ